MADAERPSQAVADPRPRWVRLLTPSRWDAHTWRVAAVVGVLVMIVAIIATVQGMETLKEKRDRVPHTLTTVAIGQEQFKQCCEVDEDGDGFGEYGWLGEMTDAEYSARRSGLRMGWSPYAVPILGVKDTRGRSTRYGRWFRMYLPDVSGTMCGEPSVLSPSRAATRVLSSDGADLREQAWACTAWQKDADAWDPRAFYVDQHGVVWVTNGEARDYRGTENGPDPVQVQPAEGALADYAKTFTPFTAKDGNEWRPARGVNWHP